LLYGAFFLFLILPYAEHARSVRQSPMINVIFFVTLLFDYGVARSLGLADRDYTITGLFTSIVAIELYVLTSEA
jgi:hypothetical protein